jgi:gamma-glutamyltranspeptidase
LHRQFATKPWGALLSDAIACATEGFVVTDSLATSVIASAAELQQDEGCRDLFLPKGRPIEAGQSLKQPALAATFIAIAARGADELYGGRVGAAVVERIQTRGGCLDLEDLRAFGTLWAEPLSSEHGGCRLHVMPPNSLGVMMLMQLRALATLPKEALNGDAFRRILWQIRAMRATFGTALPDIGDPSAMRVEGQDLLGALTISTVASRMRAELPDAIPARSGGTACVCVADAKGNAACVVQSTFNPFGAHFLDPETGILFNNRMFGFDARENLPNSIGPRKRCAHTLNPVIVTKGGQLALVYASPGGISQTITGTQVFVNLLDREMGLASAIHDARWAVDRKGDILLEPEVPSAVMSQLMDAGLQVRQMDDPYFYGSPTAIERSPRGELTAVADARRASAACAL